MEQNRKQETHMPVKSRREKQAESMAELRKRRMAGGLVRIELWVKPEKVEQIRRLADDRS
jgi:hypothetical protein